MANLKAIRQRIKSVQATQKITRAMRMVAAAKVRRAQLRVQAARPFTQAVIEMLSSALQDTNPAEIYGLPLLNARPVKKVALIILSSDRGLCGSYNTNVFREALSRIQSLQAEGKEPALILVGLKAVAFFKSLKIEKLKTYTLLPAIPTVEEAKLIAEQASESFTNGTVDAVELIGTKFISMLRSRVDDKPYLPATFENLQVESAVSHLNAELAASKSNADETVNNKRLTPMRLFEPSILELMSQQLVPKYLENVVYQALLEASASELAARMNAMTNASNNARDLISSLTLIYNKARQTGITQDLLEIVGGAEALKG
jgi:F-type H+-transporting ATPase subunit gamma